METCVRPFVAVIVPDDGEQSLALAVPGVIDHSISTGQSSAIVQPPKATLSYKEIIVIIGDPIFVDLFISYKETSDIQVITLRIFNIDCENNQFICFCYLKRRCRKGNPKLCKI